MGNKHFKVLHGNCLDTLKTLEENSIDCCVTSPPYYGLRDYDGGEHEIGNEETPEEFIDNLVNVFREVKRVLKPEGTLWINIGDSYANNNKGHNSNGLGRLNGKNIKSNEIFKQNNYNKIPNGYKQKDLIGIPWMLAFALRNDGWYLRQDIIWAKPNPMPESVKDRCTKSHEYIFLLSKSKNYYFDYEAIQEQATGYDGRKDTKMKGSIKYEESNHMKNSSPNTMASKGHERWKFKNLDCDGQQPNTFHLNRINGDEFLSPVRNKRSVWNVATAPYAGKHYAVFPPKLITDCILAGSPKNGVVLDPFGGSGTTAGVAIKHGRTAILCELNGNYINDMYDRINSIIDGHIQDETKETPLDKFFI